MQVLEKAIEKYHHIASILILSPYHLLGEIEG